MKKILGLPLNKDKDRNIEPALSKHFLGGALQTKKTHFRIGRNSIDILFKKTNIA